MPRTAKDEAHLSVTGWAYRYVGGTGNDKLTVTAEGGSLRLHRARSRGGPTWPAAATA